MQVPRTLRVPSFAEGPDLDANWRRYTEVAATMHHGVSLLAGHYTTYLFDCTDTYHVDDGAVPSLLPIPNPNPNLYMLWSLPEQP